MAKYEQYAEYKDSGVEWVKEIPRGWSSVSLRWISTIYSGGTPSKTNLSYWEDGTIPWLNSGTVNQGLIVDPSTYITNDALQNSSAKWIPKGSLVLALAGQGKTKGMVAQTGIDTTCNQSMAAIVFNEKKFARFVFWWLTSNYQNIRNMAGGDLRDGLNLEHLGSIKCPQPSIEEAIKIIGFLDHETAQIDSLIEKQQTLIQLLKEKRQAVISHAVTKGLNPDAPMKDSGVEWLGDVPEHWDIVKLKRLVSFSQGVQVDLGLQKHEEFDRSVKFLRIENYTQGSSDYRFINPILSQGKLVNRDELVMVRYGASAGYVGSGLEGALANNLFKISPTTNTITNNFLSSFLKNSYNYFQKEMSGSAMPALNFSMVEDLIITLPPIYEQKNIADYLDEIQNHFDYLTACAEQAIQLMQERRTALISAAVTGKIDVRGWVAPE